MFTAAVITDLALWALPFIHAARHWGDRPLSADFNAAAAGVVIVVILWLSPRLRDRSDKRMQAIAGDIAKGYERREELLIKAFADALAGSPKDPTGPMPRLYPVPGGRR